MRDVETCETAVEAAVDDVTVTSHSRCSSRFRDGRCDGECDTEQTQFDGFDCLNPASSARVRVQFSSVDFARKLNLQNCMDHEGNNSCASSCP